MTNSTSSLSSREVVKDTTPVTPNEKKIIAINPFDELVDKITAINPFDVPEWRCKTPPQDDDNGVKSQDEDNKDQHQDSPQGVVGVPGVLLFTSPHEWTESFEDDSIGDDEDTVIPMNPFDVSPSEWAHNSDGFSLEAHTIEYKDSESAMANEQEEPRQTSHQRVKVPETLFFTSPQDWTESFESDSLSGDDDEVIPVNPFDTIPHDDSNNQYRDYTLYNDHSNIDDESRDPTECSYTRPTLERWVDQCSDGRELRKSVILEHKLEVEEADGELC